MVIRVGHEMVYISAHLTLYFSFTATHSPHRNMIVNKPIAIVSVDGPNLSSGFVLKEMSIFIEDEFTSRHYLFRRPVNLHMGEMDRRTERFHHQILGGLRFDEHNCASLEYYTHVGIIQSLSNHRIYCAGHIAYKFLTGLLPQGDVLDIQQISDHTFSKELDRAPCGIAHNPRYCSLSKLWDIRNFCQKFIY